MLRRWLVQDQKRYGATVPTSYGQFCPVSKAAEIVCERWTPLIVRELLVGSTRFNEIRRGLPGCSTALLSHRLRTLEHAGVVRRRAADGGAVTYQLTRAGWELLPLIQGLGEWGQRWVRSDYEGDLDADLLMWDIHRYVTNVFGGERRVVRFDFPEQRPRRRHYWLVLTERETDVCHTDPGWPVDLIISADLRALTRVWMGDTSFTAALRAGEVVVDGSRELVRQVPDWFGQHPVLAAVRPANAVDTSAASP